MALVNALRAACTKQGNGLMGYYCIVLVGAHYHTHKTSSSYITPPSELCPNRAQRRPRCYDAAELAETPAHGNCKTLETKQFH